MALSCLKGNVQKLGLLLYSWRDLQEELRERVNGLFSLIKTKNSVAICSKSKYFQEMIQLGPDYDDVWDIISFKINRDIVDSVFDILKNIRHFEDSVIAMQFITEETRKYVIGENSSLNLGVFSLDHVLSIQSIYCMHSLEFQRKKGIVDNLKSSLESCSQDDIINISPLENVIDEIDDDWIASHLDHDKINLFLSINNITRKNGGSVV